MHRRASLARGELANGHKVALGCALQLSPPQSRSPHVRSQVKSSFLLFFLGPTFLCLGAGGASSDVWLAVWLGIAILVTPIVTLFLYRSICLNKQLVYKQLPPGKLRSGRVGPQIAANDLLTRESIMGAFVL